MVGDSSIRKEEESTSGMQVSPSTANRSPAGQRHTALSPAASKHMWEHWSFLQGFDTLGCKRGWTTYTKTDRGDSSIYPCITDEYDNTDDITTVHVYSMHSHFEAERLSGSLENNFAVLASQFIGTLNGSSTSVRPVDHVIKHSHRERTGHLRQL